jgi:hypothetical protein
MTCHCVDTFGVFMEDDCAIVSIVIDLQYPSSSRGKIDAFFPALLPDDAS